MSSLKQLLSDGLKAAMRSKDKQRLTTIRLILAAVKQKEVDERVELDDRGIIEILDKLCKQRRESIKQFELANRDDLIANESEQLAIIQEFLPPQLDEQEIKELAQKVMQELQADSIKDMGKVVAALKPLLQGRADLSKASALVKQILTTS